MKMEPGNSASGRARVGIVFVGAAVRKGSHHKAGAAGVRWVLGASVVTLRCVEDPPFCAVGKGGMVPSLLGRCLWWDLKDSP